MLDIAKSRHLEAMTVTLKLSLFEAAVVLDSKFKSPVLKLMSSKAHELI